MTPKPFSGIKCCQWGETKKREMLAVLYQVELASGLHTDKTAKYLHLILLKLLLDAGAFYLYSHKSYKHIFTVCGLSIVVADVVLTCSLAAVWLVGADRSPVPLCFLLASASAAYGALPLPLMLLGLLEHCLHNSYLRNLSTRCQCVKNAALVSLGWLLALIYSQIQVKAEAREMSCPQLKAVACEVNESAPISLFVLTVSAGLVCAMLPFLPRVPQWVIEANRLSQVREEEKSQTSDLFIRTDCERQKEQRHLVRTKSEGPPLWISLALGFGTLWIPYLTISVMCLLLNLSVPSYITVNVLWLECVNSFLTGFVFWIKSNNEGPYSQLPENVCTWNVYWHLSNGTRDQGLPIAVFNPSKVKRSSMFSV